MHKVGVDLVHFGQTSTIHENHCANKTLEKPDMVEVKENIYHTVQENLEILNSVADQSEL